MHAEAMTFFLAGTSKIGIFYKGYLKKNIEFIHQQGCENNVHKLEMIN